jgi:hypothetical protein
LRAQMQFALDAYVAAVLVVSCTEPPKAAICRGGDVGVGGDGRQRHCEVEKQQQRRGPPPRALQWACWPAGSFREEQASLTSPELLCPEQILMRSESAEAARSSSSCRESGAGISLPAGGRRSEQGWWRARVGRKGRPVEKKREKGVDLGVLAGL